MRHWLFFLGKRFLLGVLVLLGVVLITFIVTHVIPSDPAAKWAGPRATPEQLKAARIELGLDKPIYIQFGDYLLKVVHGDLGKSLKSHMPVTQELLERLPATIELVLWSTIAAFVIGLPLGVLSAQRKGKLLDHFIRFFSVGAVSLPSFWNALLFQLVFFSFLGILPFGGQVSQDIQLFSDIPHVTGFLMLDSLITGNFPLFKDVLLHMIMPGLALAAYPMGLSARMTRAALLEILNEDYIRSARSYGLKERKIIWSYAVKNSLGPTITVITLSIGYTLVNTFLVESIFSWPGIGYYVAVAITNLDFPAIMGVTLFSACSYVVLNLLADIVIALDPRVRK
jgi:peptide/nickel transport system permease protein